MWGGVQPVPPPPLPPPLPLHQHYPPPLPTTALHLRPHPHKACGTCLATSKPPRLSTPGYAAVSISARSAATWWRRRPCAARVTTRVPCSRLLTRVGRPTWATWGAPGLAATACPEGARLAVHCAPRASQIGPLPSQRLLGCSEAKAACFPLSTLNAMGTCMERAGTCAASIECCSAAAARGTFRPGRGQGMRWVRGQRGRLSCARAGATGALSRRVRTLEFMANVHTRTVKYGRF